MAHYTFLVIEMPDKKNMRQSDRKSVSMQAVLKQDSKSYPCGVLNLSTGGSKIEIAQILERDQEIGLSVGGGKTITGHVAWSQTPYHGLRFDDGNEDIAETVMAIAMYGNE